MIPPINLDTILSDPMLIVASVLLVVSPVVFLVAFIKFLRAPKPARERFVIPHDDMESPVPAPITSLAVEPPKPEPEAAPDKLVPVFEFPAEPAPPPPPRAPEAPQTSRPQPPASEETMVMPSGLAEMQGQVEIAFSQIKTLNSKIAEMSDHILALEREILRLKSSRPNEGRPPVMPI